MSEIGISRVINEQVVEVPQRKLALDVKNVVTLRNTATPNVENLEVLRGSGAVVTITNFLKGQNGQTIRILGDGTTTVDHNATIKRVSGAAGLLAADRMYTFTYLENLASPGGVWYE